MPKAALQSVDMVRADGAPIAGLVPVRGRASDAHRLSVDERAVVIDAESFEHVDFVFFRRFSDARSSHVAAYVVDNSDERLNEQALAKLHLQLWLHGTAPLLYVAWPSRIDVLSCARGPDFWVDEECRYEPVKRLVSTAAAVSEELRQFSAFRLADGTFWGAPENNALANYAKAAHQSLIQAIVEADSELEGAQNPIVRRLLLLTVLVKYLEDRRVFPDQGWFGRWHKGARSFFEVLQGGEPDEVKRLLVFLENKFNGDVFRLPDDGRRRLTKDSLGTFAELVEGKTLKRQRYLWEQYSFEHLPVEVISNLYQRFVQGGHGTVYTPPFLASLLLDQAMPYDKLTGEERILDPACGSGIFLVGAFRRLVNIWRSKNHWRKPDVATLKNILAESIHGIELDPFAVDLTAFSLSLAVCDALQPDVIWKELKFERLRGRNLQEGDFFDEVLNCQKGTSDILKDRFDVVIGNPPFLLRLSDQAKRVESTSRELDRSRPRVPRKQIACLFLEQSLDLLNKSGRLCLIQNAGFLYYSGSMAFRKYLFQKYRIERILDFVSIRGMYEADAKTIAVLGRGRTPRDADRIDHWTLRRTISAKEQMYFELDHYDRHSVSQERSVSDPYVWRVNLLGGGRLSDISQRFQGMRTLNDYVKAMGWDYGEGFKGGSEERADWLTGKPLLPTKAFTKNGIDRDQITVLRDQLFGAVRNARLFSPPLILLKENEAFPIAYWDEGPVAYRRQITGIHAPESEASQLREFHDHLTQNALLYRFLCTLHSTRSLIDKATDINKEDFDRLPCPEKPDALDLAFWEKVLCDDVVSYMAEYVRLGQGSKLLQHAAGPQQLRAYSDLFVRMLGSVYDNLRTGSPVFLNGLICQPFYFGDRPDLSWLSENAQDDLCELVYDAKRHESLRTIRVFRFYAENVLLLVKPDRLRYWIRSTAIRDVDETLVDLRRQGY